MTDTPNAPPGAEDYTPAGETVEMPAPEACPLCGYPANEELGQLHPGKYGNCHLVCATSKASQEVQEGLEARLREAQRKADDAEAKAKSSAPKSACDNARERALEAAELFEQSEKQRNQARELLTDAGRDLEECQRKEKERLEAAARALAPPEVPEPVIQYQSSMKLTVRWAAFTGIGGILMTLFVFWVVGGFDPVEPEVRTVTKTETVTETVPGEWPEPLVRFKLYNSDSRKALLTFLQTGRGQLFDPQRIALQNAADEDNVVLVFRVSADGKLTLVDTEEPNDP